MRKFLASLALVTAVASQAATDTTWQYTPYSNEVNDIQIFRKSPNPLLWLGTNHGVVRIKGTDTLWLHPTNSALPYEIIDPNTHRKYDEQGTFTALDSSGNYWIAYRYKHKLVKIDTLGAVTVIDSGLAAPIKNLGGLSATKSDIYFGNQDGTVYTRGIKSNGIWSPVSGTSTLDAGIRLTAIETRNDTLWVGYEGDANGNLRYIPFGSGTAGRFTSSTGEKVVGSVYGIWHSEAPTANYMYLRVSNPSSYGYYDADTLFTVNPFKVVTKYFEAEAGSLVYIRTIGDYPAFHKANGSVMNMTATNYTWGGSFPADIVAGARDTGLSFFLGSRTLNGFCKLLIARSNSWHATPYGPSLRGTKIVSSTSSPNGTLYIATDSAVYQRTDASSSLTRIYGVTTGTIRSLSLDSAGKLNIGQSNGLYKWINGSTTYITAMSDSILAMAHSKTYSWYLTRTVSGIAKLWVYTAGVTAPSQVVLTGIGSDSTLITKMRALEDNTLWALANGKIYTWTTASWKNWTGIVITGNGPGTGTFGNFDLVGNNLWTSYQTKGQIYAYSWGTATMANSSLIASGTDVNNITAPLFAESDASAWYFNSSKVGSYSVLPDPSKLMKMNAADNKVVTSFSSATSKLHQGIQCAGEALFSDKDGGLWVVMTEGVSRMKVTTTVGLSARTAAPSFASLQAGSVQVSLTQASAVRYEILDLSGRVLEMKNLGILSEGSHVVSLPKANGMRILRVKAGDRSETLRLPAL